MHREIMQPPEGMVVDHISGNGFDNTRANMRNVTPRENTVNQRKRVGAAFIYKGIKCRGSAGKWYAEVRCGDACARAGPFVDEAEAGRAYDRMAVELFGETAGLNFPEEWPPEKRAQVYAEAQPKREALLAQAAAKKRKGKKKSDKG